MRQVWILYEDKSSSGAMEPGLHKLVTRYVCDHLGVEPWEGIEKRLIGRSKGGNANVLKECRLNLGKIARGHFMVVALYDADQITTLVQLPGTACKSQILPRLRDGCEPADRLLVVLLEDNLETVLRAIRDVEPTLVAPEVFAQALRHRRSLNERDLILGKAAQSRARLLREQVILRVPSLGYLVRRILTLLQEQG